jgi:predicted small secreted protein
MKRLLLPLLILVLVLVATSMTLGACGSTIDGATALMDKEAAVWANKDTAGAREIYTNDAVVYMPVGSGDSDMISGIEEIVKAVEIGVNNQQYGDALTLSVPTDDKALPPAYRGATYVTQPSIVTAGGQSYLFTVILEVRDGKIANQWITQMYRD